MCVEEKSSSIYTQIISISTKTLNKVKSEIYFQNMRLKD